MTRDDLPDDELMTRFGAVLHDEAQTYQPSSDSLARIQGRAVAPAGRTAWRWAAPLAAAAVVVGITSAVVLRPDADHTSTPAPGTSISVPQPTSSPSPNQSDVPSPNPSKTAPVSNGCLDVGGDPGYAYYASDLNGKGLRLYRGTIVASCNLGIEEVLDAPAGMDPDFTTVWPRRTKVLSVSVDGAVATVNLSDFPKTSREGETAAVQQLVWTVTANDPSITSVRLLVNGAQPVAKLDWSQPIRRGNSLATLSNVWILSPVNGSTIGSPVTVRIYGTGYEGQVPLRVYHHGTEVASGAVTTQMGGFAEATTTFDLPPGTYELRAYNDNGQNSDLELWDTKVFTVH